jgi:WXXGXW repeat (2 copies)
MIKYVLPAAVAVIALGAPALVQAQTAMPQPLTTTTTTTATTNANAAISGQPQPGPNDYQGQAYGAPMPMYPPQPGFTPRTVWIPGGYSWDPGRNTYVWSEGQYVEAPRENAQWVSGHWAQTPTAWIWVDGRWN